MTTHLLQQQLSDICRQLESGQAETPLTDYVQSLNCRSSIEGVSATLVPVNPERTIEVIGELCGEYAQAWVGLHSFERKVTLHPSGQTPGYYNSAGQWVGWPSEGQEMGKEAPTEIWLGRAGAWTWHLAPTLPKLAEDPVLYNEVTGEGGLILYAGDLRNGDGDPAAESAFLSALSESFFFSILAGGDASTFPVQVNCSYNDVGGLSERLHQDVPRQLLDGINLLDFIGALHLACEIVLKTVQQEREATSTRLAVNTGKRDALRKNRNQRRSAVLQDIRSAYKRELAESTQSLEKKVRDFPEKEGRVFLKNALQRISVDELEEEVFKKRKTLSLNSYTVQQLVRSAETRFWDQFIPEVNAVSREAAEKASQFSRQHAEESGEAIHQLPTVEFDRSQLVEQGGISFSLQLSRTSEIRVRGWLEKLQGSRQTIFLVLGMASLLGMGMLFRHPIAIALIVVILPILIYRTHREFIEEEQDQKQRELQNICKDVEAQMMRQFEQTGRGLLETVKQSLGKMSEDLLLLAERVERNVQELKGEELSYEEESVQERLKASEQRVRLLSDIERSVRDIQMKLRSEKIEKVNELRSGKVRTV